MACLRLDNLVAHLLLSICQGNEENFQDPMLIASPEISSTFQFNIFSFYPGKNIMFIGFECRAIGPETRCFCGHR